VTAVNPNTGLYTVTTPVTVTGTGFTGATRVEFGMNDATGLVVDSATSLRCNVPIHNAAGPCHCAVFTPNGSGRKDNAFTYIAPPPPPGVPVIQSISPNVGWTGTQARITGLWFAEPLTVEFIHSGQSYPWGVTIRDSACDPYTGAGWIDITMGDSMAGGDYDCTVTAAGGSHTYPELFYGSP
jgi:hypothetical protein